MIHESSVIEFPRRSGEIYVRLAWGVALLGALKFIVWRLAGLFIVLWRSPGRATVGESIVVVGLVSFVVGVIYLVGLGAITLRRAFADRFQPLITLDQGGVTLHRTNPVMVPWSDICDAELERAFRGTTILLRIGVTDPAVKEAGKNGRVISLQPLAGEPAELLATIRSYPSFQPQAAGSRGSA